MPLQSACSYQNAFNAVILARLLDMAIRSFLINIPLVSFIPSQIQCLRVYPRESDSYVLVIYLAKGLPRPEEWQLLF